MQRGGRGRGESINNVDYGEFWNKIVAGLKRGLLFLYGRRGEGVQS